MNSLPAVEFIPYLDHIKSQVLQITESYRFLLLQTLEQKVFGSIARIWCEYGFGVSHHFLRPIFGAIGSFGQTFKMAIEFCSFGGSKFLLGQLNRFFDILFFFFWLAGKIENCTRIIDRIPLFSSTYCESTLQMQSFQTKYEKKNISKYHEQTIIMELIRSWKL